MDEKTKTPEVIVEQTSEQADLSLFGLIVEADFFVQFIMFLLLLSSVWCWTIIINKSRLFRKEKRISKFLKNIIIAIKLTMMLCLIILVTVLKMKQMLR